MNHVLCCINDAYAQHCAVLLVSLFENNKDLSFHIHIFGFTIGDESCRKLEETVRSYGQEISVCVIERPQMALPNIKGHYISAETYMRLFVPPCLDGSIKKILYLDVDMVVVGSVRELFSVPLSDNLLAAVMDAPREGRNERLGIPSQFGYFNAGLQLINVEKWKELDMTRKCNEFMRTKSHLIVMHDQDVLNALAYDKWLRLPPKWNIFNAFFLHPASKIFTDKYGCEVEKSMKDVRIVHFCGPVKPWTAWVPQGFVYRRYLRFTLWKNCRPSLHSQWKAYKFPKNILALSGFAGIAVRLINKFRK